MLETVKSEELIKNYKITINHKQQNNMILIKIDKNNDNTSHCCD